MIGIVGLNDSEESFEFGHNSKNTHRLGPSVPEGSFCTDYEFIAEPVVEGSVEKDHTCIHVEASFIVHDLMSENISHGGSLGVSGIILDVVDSMQKVITERKTLFGYILLRPDLELEIRIELHVHL